MNSISSKLVARCAYCTPLLLGLLIAHTVTGQERDRGNRRDPGKNRRSASAQARSSTDTSAQASVPADDQVFQATRLIGTPIRLSDGERLGFVEDFVVDNAGRVPFVITGLDSENVAIPFPALSFARISSGSLSLDIPITMIDGMPRFTNVAQLSEPAFQNRLVGFFQDTAGLNGISSVRFAPQEIRPATTLLGTNIRTLDGQTFGSMGDLIIDRNGSIQFATTAFNGSLIPIPFSGMNLSDLRTGFVTLSIPSSALVDAPRLTSVTTIDPTLRSDVNTFFLNAEQQAANPSTARTQSVDTRTRQATDQQAKQDRVSNERARDRADDQNNRSRADRRNQQGDRRDAQRDQSQPRDTAQRQARARDNGNKAGNGEDRRGSTIDISANRDNSRDRNSRDNGRQDAREDDQDRTDGTRGFSGAERRQGMQRNAGADADRAGDPTARGNRRAENPGQQGTGRQSNGNVPNNSPGGQGPDTSTKPGATSTPGPGQAPNTGTSPASSPKPGATTGAANTGAATTGGATTGGATTGAANTGATTSGGAAPAGGSNPKP